MQMVTFQIFQQSTNYLYPHKLFHRPNSRLFDKFWKLDLLEYAIIISDTFTRRLVHHSTTHVVVDTCKHVGPLPFPSGFAAFWIRGGGEGRGEGGGVSKESKIEFHGEKIEGGGMRL